MKKFIAFLLLTCTAINPVWAQDADSDGASDSLETLSGFNPNDDSSTPPDLSAIGINFYRSSVPGPYTWEASEAYGYIPQTNWNHIGTFDETITATSVNGPVAGQVIDENGNNTGVALNISYRFTSVGYYPDTRVGRIFNAYLNTRDPLKIAATISDIPYTNYDVYLYMTAFGSAGSAKIVMNPNATEPDTRIVRPLLPYREPIFAPERRTLTNPHQRANVLQYSFDGEDSFSFEITRACGLSAIQIIDRSGEAQLPSFWVRRYGETAADPNADPDGDGLNNLAEFQRKTDPTDPDSDDDGLNDLVETNTGILVDSSDTGSDPNFVDSDEDGDTDYFEVYAFNQSDPNKLDSDDDGLGDQMEREYGLSARDASVTDLPLPSVNTSTQFRWEIPHVNILWDHDRFWNQNFFESSHRIISFRLENASRENFKPNSFNWGLEFGLIFKGRKLLPAYYSIGNSTFSRVSGAILRLEGTEDLTAACGFSGIGDSDNSDPLSFIVEAERSGDQWTVTNIIINERTNQEIYRVSGAAEATASINNGTAVWRNKADDDQVPFTPKGREIEFYVGDTASDALPRFEANPDLNSDGIADAWATQFSITDASADPDGDGLSNLAEFLGGSDPTKKDTDGDGADDGVEFANFTDASNANTWPLFTNSSAPTGGDFNGNGLSDLWEARFAPNRVLNPNADPDGDGMSNRQESIAGTDPFDASSLVLLSTEHTGNSLRFTWGNFPYKQTRLAASGTLTDDFSILPGMSSGSEMPFDEMRQFFRLQVNDLDSDNDGLTNAQEIALGTDPQQANSVGRPVAQDLNGDGVTDRTISGDYAFFADRYANNHELSDGTPGNQILSPREASRFLMQTTYGPRAHEIEEVRAMGIEAWIENQIQKPTTRFEPIIDEFYRDLRDGQRLTGIFVPRADTPQSVYAIWGDNIGSAFATAAIKGEDQLRQRIAFALSQLFVVSIQNTRVDREVQALGNYYDMLSEHAFGNYFDLLKAVTRHRVMGVYLNSEGNIPPEPENNLYPDENYGREVMQLFSIGIHELNNDGTFRLDEKGLRIETYDQFDVTEMARVFTGLRKPGGLAGNPHRPMQVFASTHDFQPKEILKRFTIPAKEPTNENGEEDVDQTLEVLFNHENCPPYISQSLIKFLITDNPSPAYVERVTNVFIDDGQGVRGNLEAVWKAILLDPEARDIALADTQPQFGRLRDPAVRYMHLSRLLRMDKIEHLYWWENNEQFTIPMAQFPLKSPTVFNFYKPDYQPPGKLIENGFVGGPFEILDSNTSVGFPNLIWDTLVNGYGVTTTQGHFRNRPSFEEFMPYVRDTEALLDHINLVTCAGRMKAGTRRILLEELSRPYFENDDNLVEKISMALYGAFVAPEGAVQK